MKKRWGISILAMLMGLLLVTTALAEDIDAPVAEVEEFIIGGEEEAVEAVEAEEAEAKAVSASEEAVPMAAGGQITLANVKDNGEITLAVGETRQIVPSFATANGWRVTEYKSSKDKYVTVDGSGVVRAVAEGKAKITVKTNGKKATVKIKVVDPYKPEEIAITQGKELTLTVGQTVRLGTALTPSTARATLEWKSSKDKYVTVDGSGNVRAVSEGSAKITVKTQNKKKATIKIKVVDPYKPDSIAIAQGKEITLEMGQSIRLNAVLTPSTARTTLEWKSSKDKYVTVDGSGLVTAVGKGSAKITVKTANGKKATIKVKVENANDIGFPIELTCGGTACWSEIKLYDDWSFDGSYGWREDGWGSPSGTGTIQGKMTGITKIGKYTYKMTIGSYKAKAYGTNIDDEENVYGIRGKGDVLYLYLPGIDSNNILGWEYGHQSATDKYYMYNQNTRTLFFVY